MDLQEWEIVPDDGFLEINYDKGKQIFSRKYVNDQNNVFNMDYFICPETVPIKLEAPEIPVKLEDPEIMKEVNQDQVSQVFFKKMKENEFVDIKMDSPKSINNKASNIMHHHQVENKVNSNQDEGLESKKKMIKKNKEDDEEDEGNWKWRLSGIGAICSFGVAAAATLCIIFLGGDKHKNKHHHHHHHQQSNHKLHFHLYTDDKKMNEAVRQATRLSGISINRAHITVGGYCDAF